MRSVLVTHADEPIGRRVAKALFHDDRVGRLLAIGEGPSPRAFDRFVADAPTRFVYHTVDIARHRQALDFFRSKRFLDAGIDTVVYVPRHARRAPGAPIVSGLPVRTAETRLVLQHALEAASVEHLVAIGSAFVYRLPPGNANRLRETSELELDPSTPPGLRSWIDCDMILHGEIGSDRLRVALLRVATVVAAGGYVYLNPILGGSPGWRLRPLGFDPMCALVSDKDVAKAVQSAMHRRAQGIFNIAGSESVPLSVLGRWTGRPSLGMPGGMLEGLGRALSWIGHEAFGAAKLRAPLRYGFTLDTRLAERVLGFRPRYHVGLVEGGDGRPQLETSPV